MRTWLLGLIIVGTLVVAFLPLALAGLLFAPAVPGGGVVP